jgi:hypothetical protein
MDEDKDIPRKILYHKETNIKSTAKEYPTKVLTLAAPMLVSTTMIAASIITTTIIVAVVTGSSFTIINASATSTSTQKYQNQKVTLTLRAMLTELTEKGRWEILMGNALEELKKIIRE